MPVSVTRAGTHVAGETFEQPQSEICEKQNDGNVTVGHAAAHAKAIKI